MAMEKLEIMEFILAALRAGDFMVDFQQIPVLEEQTAAGALASLSLEQQSDSLIDLRMSSHAGTPVNPIGVKRGAVTLDFDMPLNRGVIMHR
jgi:hypothetical protein